MERQFYTPAKIIEPKIETFEFNYTEKECLQVRVEGQDYEECVLAASKRWSETKLGVYGEGIGATDKDKHKPSRTGLLGEMAFSKLTGLPVDISYREGGDNYDFLISNYSIDVKCAMYGRDNIYIYYRNEWGKLVPLKSDIYVGGFIEEEDRETNSSTVVLTGFAYKDEIKKCKIAPAPRGNKHYNYEVPVCDLHSIKCLIDKIGNT